MKPGKKLTPDEVLEMLQTLDQASHLRPDDLTLTRLHEKFGWGHCRAKRHLDRMVEAGALVCLEIAPRFGGRPMRVWRVR